MPRLSHALPLFALALGCTPETNPLLGVYFVKLHEPEGDVVDIARALAEQYKFDVIHTYDGVTDGFSAVLPIGVSDELESLTAVDYVIEDGQSDMLPPDEPNSDIVIGDDETPQGIARIGGPYSGSADLSAVGVAVIDTGVDSAHPDLNVVAYRDIVGERDADDAAEGADPQGHGTHVAGTIGAIGDGEGVVGVAPGAPIYAVRVLGSDGTGYMTDIIAGLEYAYQEDAIRVINLSLGGPAGSSLDDEVDQALAALEDAGKIICIAAGNEAADTANTVPAGLDRGIVVSAYNTRGGSDRGFASFSNFGDEVDITAPGVDILSTYPGGDYAGLSGTSMATPHVAGAAAVYLARFTSNSADDFYTDVLASAEDGLDGQNGTHPEPMLDLEALLDQ